MNKHYGWTVWGILGFVFAPIALIFIPVGFIVNAAKELSQNKLPFLLI